MTKEKKLRQHNYQTSKDYALLWELLKEQRIACFVDYDEPMDGYQIRDICQTQIKPLFDGKYFDISVRGYSYISADGKEDFITQCEKKNLEFIMPNIWQPQTITFDTKFVEMIKKGFKNITIRKKQYNLGIYDVLDENKQDTGLQIEIEKVCKVKREKVIKCLERSINDDLALRFGFFTLDKAQEYYETYLKGYEYVGEEFCYEMHFKLITKDEGK